MMTKKRTRTVRLLLALGIAMAGSEASNWRKLTAQADTAKPTEPALDPLETYLRRCQEKIGALHSLSAQIRCTVVDKTFSCQEVYEGTIAYLKADTFMQDLHKKANPKTVVKFIRAGNLLYEFRPTEQKILVHDIGKTRREMQTLPHWLRLFCGPLFDDPLFWGFPLALRVGETKRLFQCKLVKEDQGYVYVDLNPQAPGDQTYYQRGRLVLNKATGLPLELWLEQPNGNEIKWDFLKIEDNLHVKPTFFTNPQVPPGWKLERLPRETEIPRQDHIPPQVIPPAP